MTVAELIEHLQGFDSSLPVVINGFDEEGFIVAPVPSVERLLLAEQENMFYEYVEAEGPTNLQGKGEPFDAVWLG